MLADVMRRAAGGIPMLSPSEIPNNLYHFDLKDGPKSVDTSNRISSITSVTSDHSFTQSTDSRKPLLNSSFASDVMDFEGNPFFMDGNSFMNTSVTSIEYFTFVSLTRVPFWKFPSGDRVTTNLMWIRETVHNSSRFAVRMDNASERYFLGGRPHGGNYSSFYPPADTLELDRWIVNFFEARYMTGEAAIYRETELLAEGSWGDGSGLSEAGTSNGTTLGAGSVSSVEADFFQGQVSQLAGWQRLLEAPEKAALARWMHRHTLLY